MGWAAAAIAGSAAISAGTSLYGSSVASKAAKSAADRQDLQYQTTRSDLSPYFGVGQNALSDAYRVANSGTTGGGTDYVAKAEANVPGAMTQEALEKTPGYQFNLDQGLKATQSNAAARGLGVSGASLKGAAKYATGLADSTYQNQFNNQQSRFTDFVNLNTAQQGNLTNQFNRYNALAGLGETAASNLGQQGVSLSNAAGNYINQAGLDTASGIKGVGDAVSSGVSGYLGYDLYKDRTSAIQRQNNTNNVLGTSGYVTDKLNGYY